MKRLYLLRHAQALGTDYNAKLTAYGIKEAERAGGYLMENRILPELVLCSSAARTVSTCNIVFEGFENKPDISIVDELYAATANELLDTIKLASTEVNSLMITAHNPGITKILTELKHIEYGKFYAKALDTIATCKLVSVIVSSDIWLDIKHAPCIINDVYWPNSGDMLSQKVE